MKRIWGQAGLVNPASLGMSRESAEQRRDYERNELSDKLWNAKRGASRKFETQGDYPI